jgi:hypothetical protein
VANKEPHVSNRRLCFLFSLLQLAPLPFAHPEPAPASLPNVIIVEKDTTQYVFDGNVNLRREPSAASAKIGHAVIGDTAAVLERTDRLEILYGRRAYWYQVRVNDVTGYCWGGLLSTRGAKADFDGDGREELILCQSFTTNGSVPEDYHGFRLRFENEFRLCRRGELLSADPFADDPGRGVTMEAVTSLGFKPELVFIRFDYSFADAGAGMSRTRFFNLCAGRFHLAVEESSSMNEDSGSGVKAVFPKEHGRGNTILLETFEMENNPVSGKQKKYTVLSRRVIVWDGAAFKPAP